MKYALKMGVKDSNGVVMRFRKINIRERLLRLLLGERQKLTVIIPGDSVESLSIEEIKGGEKSERPGKTKKRTENTG